MDDYLEIDLRKYIKLILSKWYWILAPAVILGTVVFVYYSFFVPDLYKATEQVLVSSPVFFSSSDSDNLSIQPQNAIPADRFALSDETITTLSERWDYEDKDAYSIEAIRGFLSFQDVEGKYYQLSVEFEDSEGAVSLVNLWAEVFVEKYNAEIIRYYENYLERLKTQLAEKKTELDQAHAEFLDFQLSDPRELLKDQLNAVKLAQSSNFFNQHNRKNIKTDIEIMLDQLIGQLEDTPVEDSLRISYYLIQSQLVGGGSGISLDAPMDSQAKTSFTDGGLPSGINNSPQVVIVGSGISLDLMIDFQADPPMTVGELRSDLDNLSIILDNKIEQLENSEEDYISSINQHKSEIQYYDDQAQTILSEVSIINDSYEILLGDYEDFVLATQKIYRGVVEQDTYSQARLSKLEDNTNRNTLIAVFAGGFLGVAGILMVNWWNAGGEVYLQEDSKREEKI